MPYELRDHSGGCFKVVGKLVNGYFFVFRGDKQELGGALDVGWAEEFYVVNSRRMGYSVKQSHILCDVRSPYCWLKRHYLTVVKRSIVVSAWTANCAPEDDQHTISPSVEGSGK